MKINTKDWKEFKVRDLFYMKKGKSLSLQDKEHYFGNIPCVNGSTNNNGIFTYLSDEIEEIGFVIQKAPCITLCRVGKSGYTNVQCYDFYIADNAYALHLKKSSPASVYVYLFLSTILNKETYRYNYGRIINSSYYDTIIRLPVDNEQLPDWHYMEQYIKTLRHKPITTTRIKEKPSKIEIDKWGEYTLGELFKFYKGKRLTKEDMTEGNVNFIGAVSENNGVRQFIDSKPIFSPNCITINYNGSVGEAFYQLEPFWASDDVNVLYADGWDLNKYIAMFIITIIKTNRYKFSYGRKWTLEKMKESAIRLPKSQDGSPDFVYMENYIRTLPYSDRI